MPGSCSPTTELTWSRSSRSRETRPADGVRSSPRHPTPTPSALFLYLNTNKRSITLDAGRDRGREFAERLISSVDVVIESYPPGTLEAWGLGFEKMQAVNRSITLTSITPFGQDGPYRDYQGQRGRLLGSGRDELHPGMGWTTDRPGWQPGSVPGRQPGRRSDHGRADAGRSNRRRHPRHVSHLLAQVGSASGRHDLISSVTPITDGHPRHRGSSPEAPSARSPFGPLPKRDVPLRRWRRNGQHACGLGPPHGASHRGSGAVCDLRRRPATGRARYADRVHAIASAWFASRSAGPTRWPRPKLPAGRSPRSRAPPRWPATPTSADEGPSSRPSTPSPAWCRNLTAVPYRRWLVPPAPRSPARRAHPRGLRGPGLTVAELSTCRGRTGHLVPGTGLPLEGLPVADITVAWSGPFTTMLLADLGAEVVRVENPWAFPSSTRGVYPRPTPVAVAACEQPQHVRLPRSRSRGAPVESEPRFSTGTAGTSAPPPWTSGSRRGGSCFSGSSRSVT